MALFQTGVVRAGLCVSITRRLYDYSFLFFIPTLLFFSAFFALAVYIFLSNQLYFPSTIVPPGWIAR